MGIHSGRFWAVHVKIRLGCNCKTMENPLITIPYYSLNYGYEQFFLIYSCAI